MFLKRRDRLRKQNARPEDLPPPKPKMVSEEELFAQLGYTPKVVTQCR